MKAFFEMVMKDKKVQVLALLLTALLLANGGFYLLRTKPASVKASELETKLQENRQAIKKKQDEYRRYASYGRGKEQLESFKKMLSDKTDYTAILRKVFKIAREDGVKGSSFSTEKRDVAQQGDIVQLKFSMPVSGSYRNVRKFIYDIEVSQLFLNIESLGLASNELTGEMSVNIGLTTYARSR